MLVIPPAQSRGRRAPKVSSAPTSPLPPVTVAVVGTDDPPTAGECHWVFDSAVTLTGLPIGLRVLIDGVWRNPVSATQPAAQEIWCHYDTEETLQDKQYSIVAPPSGIAEAAQIVLPQEGTIIAP